LFKCKKTSKRETSTGTGRGLRKGTAEEVRSRLPIKEWIQNATTARICQQETNRYKDTTDYKTDAEAEPLVATSIGSLSAEHLHSSVQEALKPKRYIREIFSFSASETLKRR
jgi:hypothetical protein